MTTENNYYQVYTEGIYNLAASLMLKCNQTAVMINEKVRIDHGEGLFDPYDQTTWKYYLNITGEYFSTDTKMMITSLDNMEEILFSKANLKKHNATASGYEVGGTYYLELIDRYPENEHLIRGILYPADLDEAITSRDGTILAYPPGLIESTEYSFKQTLQDWIYGYIDRWDAPWFSATDNLYKSAFWATLFSLLPGVISNIRLKACHTKEVHTYHVMQYLSSHSRLDRYVPYMTRDQQLFFYRNIVHIQRNSGKKEIFDWLIENVFTVRQLPIADFSFAHNLEDMMTSLRPLAFFNKNPINTAENMDGITTYTLKQMLDLEEKIEPPNEKYRLEDDPVVEKKIVNSLYNQAPTKVLESSVIDYFDSEKYRLTDILLQHWIWFAANNLYTSFIRFTVPSQGIEMSLNVKDAFTMYTYAVFKNYGFDGLDKLKTHTVSRVQRIPPASFKSVDSVTTDKRVENEWITEVMGTMPKVTGFVSVKAFRDYCNELFIAANLQYKMSCLSNGYNRRAQTHLAYSRLWGVNKVYLGDEPDQTYRDWFVKRNIALRDISDEDWGYIEGAIINAALGDELINAISLKDIQRAMINTTTTLSSYSIHIGQDINQGPVHIIGCPDIRYEWNGTDIVTKWHYDIAPDRWLWVKPYPVHHIDYNLDGCQMEILGATWRPFIKYPLAKMPRDKGMFKMTARYWLRQRQEIKLVKDSLVTTTEGRFDTLTQEQLSEIPSAW